MKHFSVDYTLFRNFCYKIYNEVRSDGKRYRAVLCPLRGGFYLSNFMSRRLNLPMVYIEINSYTGKERREFKIGIKSDLEYDRFLLCDDIFDSGNTVAKIHEIYPGVIFDTACLVSKIPGSPSYYGIDIEKHIWVDFFWEVM